MSALCIKLSLTHDTLVCGLPGRRRQLPFCPLFSVDLGADQVHRFGITDDEELGASKNSPRSECEDRRGVGAHDLAVAEVRGRRRAPEGMDQLMGAPARKMYHLYLNSWPDVRSKSPKSNTGERNDIKKAFNASFMSVLIFEDLISVSLFSSSLLN